jgi:hypothetical protein
MKAQWMMVLACVVSAAAFAHEGDHDAPGSVQAPRGGLIRSTEDSHYEVLVKGKEIEIFAYDLALKPLALDQVTLAGTVTLPRKKPQPITITKDKDRFRAQFDAKGAHRYELRLAIQQGSTSHSARYTIEPKK